jgi:hypothetical protein
MMSKEDFFHFLKKTGGLINSGRKMDGPVYNYGCQCDAGWLELIAELIRELVEAGWTREILQIKEKFGGLRFYADGLSETCAKLIIKYEKRSYTICELCGSTDNVRLCGHRWVKTLCEECGRPWLQGQYLIKLPCVHRQER